MSFILIKEKINTTLILTLLNFDKLFDTKCDTCSVRIGGV
jgi:hypothetical protein